MKQYVVWYYLFINMFSFFIMIWDKGSAIGKLWRIAEKTLLILAILGGAFGLYLASKLVRHKTQKKIFMIGLPIIIVLHLFLLAFIY